MCFIPHNKKDLEDILFHSVMHGIQRVPTILINDTSQSLQDINLAGYTVLDCEPLHDLKGHFINLLTELPHILPQSIKQDTLQLLQNNLFRKKQNGYSVSDVRIALIEIYKFIISKYINSSIVYLLSTAVKVCEIMYALDTQRSPRSVLQLYNLTWLHHELCKSLFVKFHEVTHVSFIAYICILCSTAI